MQGINKYIEDIKRRIKVGDRIISLHDSVRGGTVTGLYPHIFTVRTPEGYIEALKYVDWDRFVIK